MDKGIKCKECGCCDLDCYDSRPQENQTRTRRYVCKRCGSRIVTVEITRDLYRKLLMVLELKLEGGK